MGSGCLVRDGQQLRRIYIGAGCWHRRGWEHAIAVEGLACEPPAAQVSPAACALRAASLLLAASRFNTCPSAGCILTAPGTGHPLQITTQSCENTHSLARAGRIVRRRYPIWCLGVTFNVCGSMTVKADGSCPGPLQDRNTTRRKWLPAYKGGERVQTSRALALLAAAVLRPFLKTYAQEPPAIKKHSAPSARVCLYVVLFSHFFVMGQLPNNIAPASAVCGGMGSGQGQGEQTGTSLISLRHASSDVHLLSFLRKAGISTAPA
jgi:hypothetical protein